jgi:ubiquinone/menaquinone biosynthesis C-methylase UbiE
MYLPDSSILTNIQVPGHTRLRDVLFEKAYITTRSLENRLYTDEELIKLPDISENHTHYKEWRLRRTSARRLLHYMSAKKRSLDVLEIGCGNGWLSHRLAELRGAEVTALDINFTELQQAARVFNDDPNLNFIHGDIRFGVLEDLRFDYIVFAATIQYFPSLKKILHLALSYLKPGGEIHLIDSHLYKTEEMETQKKRTLAYYTSLGYPEMADFYYHHSLTDLRSFHHDVLHSPHSVMSRFLGLRNPWPWVRVKNN